jgi:oligopeptide transport system substrate-binding protein
LIAIRSKLFVTVAIIAILSSFVATGSRSQSYAQGATPASGDTTVITAADQPIKANPSGDQTLVLAAPPDAPATLDPALTRDIGTTFIVRQIFRGLTRLDDTLQPVPELADRIEISGDGLVYSFHLREIARFQDGRQILAQDVAFSLTRALDPQTAGGDVTQLGGPMFLGNIVGAAELEAGRTADLTGISVMDDATIEMRLARPDSAFLMKLASVPASIVDADRVRGNSDRWLNPNGSGPFQLKDWTQGERLVLEPSATYFAGTPAMSSIEFKLGQKAARPLNLYQAGQIDVASIEIEGIDQVLAPESGLSAEIVVTPQLALEYIAFRTDVAPMDDPHIRRAVQYGFDKDKVASVMFDGHKAKTCGLIPSGMVDADFPCVDLPFDPGAAKVEIALSRYGTVENVPPIEIYIGLPGIGRTATDVFKDDLEQNTGLQIDIVALDLPEFYGGLFNHEYPAYEVYWSADYPDPESLLWTLFSAMSKDNYTDYESRLFDDALEQAASEQNAVDRADHYAEAQQILVDDAVVMPLYYDVAYTLVRPYVKGLTVTPIGILGLERIWLER